MNFIESFNHQGFTVDIYEEGILKKYFVGISSDVSFYTSSDNKLLVIERFKEAIGNRTKAKKTHYLTWYEKEENGAFMGEKELLNVNSEELERLKLCDLTYNIYPVQTLQQFSYLSQFINFKFRTDEYDYFVESE